MKTLIILTAALIALFIIVAIVWQEIEHAFDIPLDYTPDSLSALDTLDTAADPRPTAPTARD